MPQLNCFNITYDIHVMCNIFSFLNSDHRCITNSINSRSEKYPSTNADVANLHPMFRLKYFLSECTFRISPHLCDTQRETLPYEYVCTHTYFRAQVISTRIAFAIYGHTEIRVCSFRVRAHVYAPLESASRLDYIYNLLAVYRWRIRVTVWVCVLAECLRNDGCVCVRARVMCVRAERVAGVFCYIDRSRVVDHLPFSNPLCPHLSPPRALPRPCTSCSPHLLAPEPRPRVPLDVTHPKTFDSSTTSSHTYFRVLVQPRYDIRAVTNMYPSYMASMWTPFGYLRLSFLVARVDIFFGFFFCKYGFFYERNVSLDWRGLFMF